jgi:hypothetical protein
MTRQMEKLTSQNFFLVDNGSLRPESILYIRDIADDLNKSTGVSIIPSGIMHSHKVDASKLNGMPSVSMDSLFNERNGDAFDSLAIIPLFFGPSLAITDWLQKKLEEWQSLRSNREFVVADCLYRHGDERIAEALTENVVSFISKKDKSKPFVILVDHGTPLPSVNLVREQLGHIMVKKLDGLISGFSTACMERRPDSKYDFNDPLLGQLLIDVQNHGHKKVILAQLFLAPGRHAGTNGDIAEICEPFVKNGLDVRRTPVLGKHPLVQQVLSERVQEILRID